MQIAYKAFNKDLSCRVGKDRYQYVLNQWNETKKAKCVETGFHCAENPLDCLSYYSVWEQAAYYLVMADGDVNEDGTDSKIACTRLRLLKELTKETFVYAALVYMVQHPLRIWNGHVKRERSEADRNGLAISRGKDPAAKGALGSVLGLAKEDARSESITDIAVFVVDGINYLPDTLYDSNGKTVLY